MHESGDGFDGGGIGVLKIEASFEGGGDPTRLEQKREGRVLLKIPRGDIDGVGKVK